VTAVRGQAPGGDEHTVIAAQPGPPITGLVPPKAGAPVHTAICETDSRTALTRGLAEYIAQLVREQDDGRELRFQRVFYNWADTEDVAEYPSAIAYTKAPGTYEVTGSATPSPTQRLADPDGRYVISPMEYSAMITLDVYATDNEERTGLVAMLENAVNPYVGRGVFGFTLELPHYFNARATFEPSKMGYVDSEVAAIQRERVAMIDFVARVPVISLVSFPDAKPSFKLAAIDVDVVVSGNGDC
jgi:hypothetical protein